MLDNVKLPGGEIEKAAAAVIEHAGKEIVGGTSGFVSNVFNGLIGDKVREWRTRNMVDMAAKTAEKLKAAGVSLDAARGLPILEFYSIFEQASQQDDPSVQDLWAGLLAARMNPDQIADFDRQVTQLLSAMNGLEARILHFIARSIFIGRDIRARMPSYDMAKGRGDHVAYERELEALRRPLRNEWRERLRDAHADLFCDVSAPRLGRALESLDLKGIIFPLEDAQYGRRIVQSTRVDDGYHSQSVETVDIKALDQVLREIRTRDYEPKSSIYYTEPKLIIDTPDQVTVLYGFTALGQVLMEQCYRDDLNTA